MSEQDFNAFLMRLKSEEEEQKKIDWDARRDRWLSDLQALYDQLRTFIEPQVTAGLINVSSDGVLLSEDHVGSYLAPTLKIKIGERELTVSPKGMNIIGARGRADIVGPQASISLVLVQDSPDDTTRSWKIVQRGPKIELADLTQDRFFGALMLAADA